MVVTSAAVPVVAEIKLFHSRCDHLDSCIVIHFGNRVFIMPATTQDFCCAHNISHMKKETGGGDLRQRLIAHLASAFLSSVLLLDVVPPRPPP